MAGKDKENSQMTNINNLEEYEVRTDLALEAKERFLSDVEIPGVVIKKNVNEGLEITISTVIIKNKTGSEKMKRPIGIYSTLESERFINSDEEYINEASTVLSKTISKIIKKKIKKTENKCDNNLGNNLNDNLNNKSNEISALVIGLGNEEATADALGPNVCKKIYVNRHLEPENEISISCIAPGVTGKTGMETFEIIKGLIDKTSPTFVIVIDSLAAGSIKRVGTTIQITDTGITPGSGVQNHRQELTENSLGVPIIAIGVPMVVEAATIVNDTVENLFSELSEMKNGSRISNIIRNMNKIERRELIEEILAPGTEIMYVTPKDIDEMIRTQSTIIAMGINQALAHII